MVKVLLLLFIVNSSEAFYKPFNQKDIPTVIPKNVQELKKYLCAKYERNNCEDKEAKKIIINKIFDFTDVEGHKTETGCYHSTKGNCKKTGQLKLNVAGQCNGLDETQVTYSVAGRIGLEVGSNKVIVGTNGGGLKGKGLRLRNSKNVEVRNLKITDINPHVIWGGDALDLNSVTNILIDGNYIARIGRQMIVTHYASNKQVTISNNVFDGETKHSATCDGYHYWLWLFLGEEDEITLQNNVIRKTSGRGPHLVAIKEAKTVVHMIQNTFTDVKGHLIDLGDKHSSILVEGNTFDRVTKVIQENKGHIWMPQSKADAKACKKYLGRDCLPNIIRNSGGDKLKNNVRALEDIIKLRKHSGKPHKHTTIMDWIKKFINLLRKILYYIKSLFS